MNANLVPARGSHPLFWNCRFVFLPPHIFSRSTENILGNDILWRSSLLLLTPETKIQKSMEPNVINVNKLQSNSTELEKTPPKMNLRGVYTDYKYSSYLNKFNLYLAHFDSIPNHICEINIDCKKAHQWFVENYKDEIKNVYFNKRYFNGNKNAEYSDIFYILHDNLLIHLDNELSIAEFLFQITETSKIKILVRACWEILFYLLKKYGILFRNSKQP